MAVLIMDLMKHSGPRPTDEMAPQIFTLDFKHFGLCAFPLFLQTLGP